jgi:phosphoenolpyruvate-protein kinase (PTS system EI component)
MDSDLVSICTVQNPTEAEMICNALKSVGIPAVVGGEGQAGLAGVLAIDVLTQEANVGAARKYLRQLRHEKKERRKKRMEAKNAKAAEPSSEAIQELRPGSEIQKPRSDVSEPEA